MNDLYYRQPWFDQHLDKIMIAFFLSCFVLIAIWISGNSERATRHYQQCLDDGKKEYECYAIIYNGGRR